MLLEQFKTKEERRNWFDFSYYGSRVWQNKDASMIVNLENYGSCDCGFSGKATARSVPRKYQFCNLYKRNPLTGNYDKEYAKSICRECVINQVESLNE